MVDAPGTVPAPPDDATAPHLQLVTDAAPVWGAVPAEHDLTVAVLLPCRNEELTIGKVVVDFLENIPGATVYVYDNASTDGTAEAARTAGAVVRPSPAPGKGNVMRRMFSDIEADIYVLADGDDTYDPVAAPLLIRHLCAGNLDMVVGERIEAEGSGNAYRAGHRLGNRLLSESVRWVFGDGSSDMLSGYRVLSRGYVKSFPASSCGFETETEMTVHALDLNLPFDGLPTAYRERPEESMSKLRTLPDGLKILRFVIGLCKDYRPLRFFSLTALLPMLGAFLIAVVGGGRLHEWTPATFAAVVLCAAAAVSLATGVVLDSLGRSRREMKRMLYLALPSVASPEAHLPVLDIP